MEAIISFIIELLCEIILPLFGEFLVEFGLRGIAEMFENRKLRSPLLTGFAYAALGALLGALSSLVFPHYFIQNKELRLLGVILSPVVSGLCMAALGAWRRKRGQRLIRLDSFVYGFIFALAMSIVRKVFTN
ncbi:MAG: putative rane protein [Pedosphaera sp.]|nr:putative rane protein [Pedosphaera sp.]